MRAGSVQPDPAGANEILFFAIAAAVIGGTLLAGGSGTVVGALIGALFLGILKDGLVLQGVNANYLLFYLGLAIIVAATRRRVRHARAQGARQQWLTRASPPSAVVGPSSAPDDVLRVEHIAKRFGPVTALRDVNLHLRKGEVLGLLGDNGAGKSTLIKILCGFQKQDSGQMFLHGEPFQPKSVDDARSQGIETVYQDLALIDELSVYHNLFLRRERVHRPLPLLANRQMKREARVALDEIGINIPRIDVAVARLSGGQRQAIAVARTRQLRRRRDPARRAACGDGRQGGRQILDLIARLKAEGRVSIIMILHNYVQVFEACDRVSMIQDGAIALDKPTAETSVEELTEIVVEEYRRARQESQAP